MRRILIFSLVYYPRFISGAEIAIKEITDRISPSEIEFDMVTLNGGGELEKEQIGNVKVYKIFNKVGFWQKLFFPFGAFFKAVQLHKQNKYNAIWSIMANRAGFAALFFKMKYPKVPFILTLQEGDPTDYPAKRMGILYPILRPFFYKIFRKADHIQAISNYLADWARSMGATCPIKVVPNGIDYAHFSNQISPERKQEIRNQLGPRSESRTSFSSSDVVLITVSRLVHKNAVDDIITALSLLNESYKLLIIGDGEESSLLRSQASYAGQAKLKEQSARSDLANRVIFKGFVANNELPAYLQASDIFIRPSRSEGLGTSFLEAMAAGIPVIATNVGGIKDFLTDRETGLVCEVNNPESIASKVQDLTKNKELRDRVVMKAREMMKEEYQWGRIAREMAETFLCLYVK